MRGSVDVSREAEWGSSVEAMSHVAERERGEGGHWMTRRGRSGKPGMAIEFQEREAERLIFEFYETRHPCSLSRLAALVAADLTSYTAT